MNSATNTFVHITKMHLLHMIHHGNQWTNIKIILSSNENVIDYRRQEPNTFCYVQPSQQQKRNCLWMRKGPTIVIIKENIFKKKWW